MVSKEKQNEKTTVQENTDCTAEKAELTAAQAEESQVTEASAEELLAQANERYLRARADFENYRKRMAREFGEMRDFSRQQTIAEFLNVYDIFLLAVDHAEQTSDLDSMKQGLKMILAEFQRTFENLGVKQIETQGQDFDPGIHEASSQEPSEDIPEGKIIREWKAGFMINSKLLRAATVVVSSGKAKPETK